MTIVKHIVTDGSGVPVESAKVTIELSPPGCYLTDGGQPVAPAPRKSSAAGLVSFDLSPQSQITSPTDDSRYVITTPDGLRQSFQVPDQPGPYWLKDLGPELMTSAQVVVVAGITEVTLAAAIADEATARDDADTALSDRIDLKADESELADYVLRSLTQIGIDTDGVPYFSDALAFTDAVPVLVDTDGVPYIEVLP